MISMTAQQFLGLEAALIAVAFFLGLVWVMFLHWAGLDL